MTDEERLAELEDQNFTTAAHILQLRASIKAAMEVICVLGGEVGVDVDLLRKTISKRAKTNLETELLRIERQDPALAARVDLRKIEDLF
ncbi:MAG TPA: hypothetical protein PKC67_02425 [Kiritimatiellia bacterium]|nr:hypothetical protein [Kiritimatiellia bacterium]HMP33181.1 hypothetical protein [Kiritimatiellia bacterium]